MIKTLGLALGLGFSAMAAQAGTIQTLGDWEARCAYMFSGVIEAGDADKIAALETYGSAGATLCFDSPGGSMTEGLKMFDAIWNKQMRTRVQAGDRCESACAIAWLGGSMSHGTLGIKALERSIEAGATLGFHAPYLDLPSEATFPARDVEKAFNIALRAAEGIFRINLTIQNAADPLNNFLYGRILATPGTEMYRVTTIGEAVMANINVSGIPEHDRIYLKDMVTLCENAFLLHGGPSAEGEEANTYLEKLRKKRPEAQGDMVKLINETHWAVRLVGWGRQHHVCMLSDDALANFAGGGAHYGTFDVTLMGVHVWDGGPPEDVWEELTTNNGYVIDEVDVPVFGLYDPATPLSQFEN